MVESEETSSTNAIHFRSIYKQLRILKIQWNSRQKLTKHEDESQEIHLEMREGSEVWRK